MAREEIHIYKKYVCTKLMDKKKIMVHDSDKSNLKKKSIFRAFLPFLITGNIQVEFKDSCLKLFISF